KAGEPPATSNPSDCFSVLSILLTKKIPHIRLVSLSVMIFCLLDELRSHPSSLLVISLSVKDDSVSLRFLEAQAASLRKTWETSSDCSERWGITSFETFLFSLCSPLAFAWGLCHAYCTRSQFTWGSVQGVGVGLGLSSELWAPTLGWRRRDREPLGPCLSLDQTRGPQNRDQLLYTEGDFNVYIPSVVRHISCLLLTQKLRGTSWLALSTQLPARGL
uniref:Uncharacterized protein n=1 Tax=Neovison vison TaxID=452646 RepID=A0A8C7AA91_NEOVI